MRQALTQAPLQEPIAAGSIVAKSNVERYLGLLDQKREVGVRGRSAPTRSRKDVKVDDAAVKAYYDANQAAFQTPEQVKIEYVALTPDALGSQVKVDPAEVRKQYDDNLKQYAKAEERQASHILIAVKPDANDDEKAAAKKKAEDLAAQARANAGEVRRARQGEFAGSRFGGAGRRSRLLRARRLDGQAVRGCRLFRQGGRHRRAGADRFRLARDQGHRRQAGEDAELRRSQGRRSSRT